MEHIFFFIIAFIATTISAVAGFGTSTILIPFSLLILDIKTAIVLVAFFHLFGNLSKIAIFKKIDWKIFLKFGIPSILTAFIGAKLITTLNTETIQVIFGLFLVAFVAYSFLVNVVKFKPTNCVAVSGGLASGFLAGLIGTGGAIRSLFLNAFSLPKEIYIATSAMIALVIDMTRIPVYLMDGIVLDTMHYYYIPILIIIAFVGTLFGKKIVQKIPTETFRKVVLIALFLIGIKLLFSI
ncbi:sulfite exporter TauE/SafE family protein [Patescibacteria group bacterium]